MIERMKKITLLVSERDRQGFVSRLRKAGAVHVKHVKRPSAHQITFVEDRIAKIEGLISRLLPYSAKAAAGEKDFVYDERNMLYTADRVAEASRELKECHDNIANLRRQAAWYDLWGAFDPADLPLLEEKGVNLRFYRLSKHHYKELGREIKHHVVRRDKGYVCLVTASFRDDEKLPFAETTPPPKSPEEITQDVEALGDIAKGIEEYLAEKAAGIEEIRECEKKLKKEHESLKVRFGMKEEGRFAYLQGFCPVNVLDKVTDMARAHGSGYVVEEPDDPAETPTHITNPGWVRIISPVFQFMNTLPGYNEFDISAVFLVFFSVFFAMLIGDAGYGTLFLAATFLARRKMPHLPAQPFYLMYLLSFCTLIWGIATGTWFGAEQIAQMPVLKNLVVQKINSFAGDNQNFIIFICFVIGVAHLTIAHIMRAARVINSIRALSQVGWIMILWGMFFAAGTLVIGRAFPPYAGWLLAGGIPLALFFSNPERGILKGALGTLAQLPLSVIGAFSDIVSYLRLFAVGYATVVVAQSFNDMALGGAHGILGGLAAALILFFGHALNILLGFMAVIVHGIRLNMLEFSGHLDMQWSGRKYDPFRETEIVNE